MAHDIFISYSTRDKTIADAVCAKLEENKIRAWIAPRDVPAGSNFAAAIIQAINSCKVFVLIWSAHTNASQHIMNEVNQAFERGITIIPFRIQDVQPTDEMRYYFGRTHWLDAIDPPLEKHIASLRNTILANIGQDAPPDLPAGQPGEPSQLQRSKPDAGKTEPPVEKERSTGTIDRPADSPQPKNMRLLPFAAGGLILITLAVLGILGVFNGLQTAEPVKSPSFAGATTAPTRKPSPTRTLHPTAAATPMPAWMLEANARGQPILQAIQVQPPDFSDDFSGADLAWFQYRDTGVCPDPVEGKMNFTEGALQYGVGPGCQFNWISHPDLLFTDFVLQVDILFQPDSPMWSFTEWPRNAPMEEHQTWAIYLNTNGSWRLEVWDSAIETVYDVSSGQTRMNPYGVNRLTVIKDGLTYLYYLNDELLTSFNAPMAYEDPLQMQLRVENFQEGLSGTQTIRLDSVRAWDLDKLIIPERLLAALETRPPDFTDDFSQVDPAWKFEKDGEPNEDMGCYNPEDVRMNISDGSMKLSIVNCRVGRLIHTKMEYTNYVLQLDVNYRDNPLGLEFRNWNEAGGLLVFVLISPGGNADFQVLKEEQVLERRAGYKKVDFSRPVTITVINQFPLFVVYVNGSQVVYHIREIYQGPFGLDFTVNQWDYTPAEELTLELDSVRVWDLDRLNP